MYLRLQSAALKEDWRKQLAKQILGVEWMQWHKLIIQLFIYYMNGRSVRGSRNKYGHCVPPSGYCHETINLAFKQTTSVMDLSELHPILV